MSPHRCHGIDDTIVQWIHPHAAVTLRVLGAWWCLGSSSVEPELLIEYEAGAERKAA